MLCDAPWPARLQQWSMVDLQLPSLKNVFKKNTWILYGYVVKSFRA
jgi:hypothetical protein